MGANETVGIDVVARLDQLRAELGKIPDIGGKEAKALTAALAREVKAMETATRNAARGAKDAKDATKGFGDAAGRAGSAAGKLGQALGLVSPELGGVGRGLADAADGGEALAAISEGLGVSLGTVATVAAAVAVAVGLAFVAYQTYTEESDRAARITAAVAEAHKALEPILADSRATTIDLAVATGELTDEQGKLEKQALATATALASALAKPEEKIRALQKEQGGLTTMWADLGEQLQASGPVFGAVANLMDGMATSTSELQQEIDGLRGAQMDGIDVAKANRLAHEALIGAETGNAASSKAAAAARRDLNEAMAEADKGKAAYAAGLAEEAKLLVDNGLALDDLAAKAAALGDTETERANGTAAALQAELDFRRGIAEAAGQDTAQYAQAAVDIEVWRVAEIAKIQSKAAADQKVINDAALKELEAAAAEVAEAYDTAWHQISDSVQSIAGTMSDALANNAARLRERLEDEADTLTDSEKRQLERRAAAQEQAALIAFRVQQTAAITTIAIDTIVAAVKAVAELGPIAGAAAAIGIGASGLASGIAVAATPPPSFHRGLAPDETSATLTNSEGVANPIAMSRIGGPEGMRNLNADRPGASAPTVLELRYGHQVFDRMVVDNLRKRGPLSTAFTTSRGRVGHARRRR